MHKHVILSEDIFMNVVYKTLELVKCIVAAHWKEMKSWMETVCCTLEQRLDRQGILKECCKIWDCSVVD